MEIDIQDTIDRSINDLADMIFDRKGPSVNLSPVYNDYENKEELSDIRCEIERIKALSSDCENAISSVVYMYLSHGIVAESDKALKSAESTLLSLSRILSGYEGYLRDMKTDLETERKKYSLIFREEGENESR